MTLMVRNTGGATLLLGPAAGIASSNPSVLGPAWTGLPTPGHFLAPGATSGFTWNHTAGGCGSSTISLTVTGHEDLTKPGARTAGPRGGFRRRLRLAGGADTAAAAPTAPATTPVAVLRDAGGRFAASRSRAWR